MGAPLRMARSIILQTFSPEDSRKGAAEDGEVLGKNIDQPVIYLSPAGDHPVAGDLLRLAFRSRCSDGP